MCRNNLSWYYWTPLGVSLYIPQPLANVKYLHYISIHLILLCMLLQHFSSVIILRLHWPIHAYVPGTFLVLKTGWHLFGHSFVSVLYPNLLIYATYTQHSYVILSAYGHIWRTCLSYIFLFYLPIFIYNFSSVSINLNCWLRLLIRTFFVCLMKSYDWYVKFTIGM